MHSKLDSLEGKVEQLSEQFSQILKHFGKRPVGEDLGESVRQFNGSPYKIKRLSARKTSHSTPGTP